MLCFLGLREILRCSHVSKLAYELMEKDIAFFNDRMMMMVNGVNIADAQVFCELSSKQRSISELSGLGWIFSGCRESKMV